MDLFWAHQKMKGLHTIFTGFLDFVLIYWRYLHFIIILHRTLFVPLLCFVWLLFFCDLNYWYSYSIYDIHSSYCHYCWYFGFTIMSISIVISFIYYNVWCYKNIKLSMFYVHWAILWNITLIAILILSFYLFLHCHDQTRILITIYQRFYHLFISLLFTRFKLRCYYFLSLVFSHFVVVCDCGIPEHACVWRYLGGNGVIERRYFCSAHGHSDRRWNYWSIYYAVKILF